MASGAAFIGGASQPATERPQAHDGKWHIFEEFMGYYTEWSHWEQAKQARGRNTVALAVLDGSVNALVQSQKLKRMSSTAHGNADEFDWRMDVAAPAGQPAAAPAAPRTAAPAGEPAVAPGILALVLLSLVPPRCRTANAPKADCGASPSDRWASAWVTRAIAADLSRLGSFDYILLRHVVSEEHIGRVSHTSTWIHFLDELERCVCAQTRQELGVANVEHSRRSSACDAYQTATTAVVAMMYKLQIRSPELIDEFCNVVEQLGENQRRFVAAGIVLQRVLTGGFS